MDFAPDRLHRPASAGYDDAVRLWNGAVDRRPSLVAQPLSTAEVQTLVRAARERGLPLSVRGGGHDWAGRALADGGLVIDMSRMRAVVVDPVTRVATAAGGATTDDVVSAAAAHGLAPATGTVGDVGMAGLTLGGGYGPLNGVAGLAADNLLGADVVLADGSAVTTDAEPDLGWALRGGGGNFGAVTSMRIRLHPVHAVVAGVVMFGWHEAAQVFARYEELRPGLPDELTVQSGMLAGPDGGSLAYLAPTWSGPAAAAAPWVQRLTALGTPVVVQVGEMPYSALVHMLDDYVEWGRHHEMRTRTTAALSPGVVDVILDAGDRRTSPFSGVSIHHFHGAATRIPLIDSAFGLRSPHLMVEILAAWDPADDGAAHRQWAEDVYRALAPHALEGGYPNLIGPEQAAQAQGAYGPNAARLLSAKDRYDPDGVFSAIPLPVG